MHCQMPSHKIYVLIRVLCRYIPDLHRFLGAGDRAFRQSCRDANAEITLRIQIRNKIMENDPEWTGERAGLAARTAHLVTLDVAVGGALKRVMVTGVDARRLLAVPADRGKSSVFAQIGNAVILRVIKIVACYPAFFTLVTDV